jgi:serine protease Do
MNKTNKAFAGFAIAAAAASAWVGGDALIGHLKFARAEQEVQVSRQELKNIEGLSDVFRTVGHAVKPSVVQIQVHKTVAKPTMQGFNGLIPEGGEDGAPQFQLPQLPGGGSQEEVGTGSGVIMEVDGDTAYILTNNHVAGDATKMTVTLADGRTINNGRTIGADPKSDLAVVKITADHLIPAVWGDSSKLDRGDWVLAFGSPFGYVGSMTHGIVSALDRQAGILANVGGYEDFIQVDAPINPGNSGGPLTNIKGEVVGINTAIASRSGGFQGIGFAIPSNQARTIYNLLKEKGKVTRGWLGVKFEEVVRDPDAATDLGYTGGTGVIVDAVYKGTPSYGKLQPNDVIEKVNGKPIADGLGLRNEVAMTPPGKTVTLTVFRDKKETDVEVTLGEQPENLMATGMRQDNTAERSDTTDAAATLGLRLSDVTDGLARRYQLGDNRDGALVTSVRPGSIAEAGDLHPGDLITQVGRQSVANADEATKAIAKRDIHKGIRLTVTNSTGNSVVTLSDQGQ